MATGEFGISRMDTHLFVIKPTCLLYWCAVSMLFLWSPSKDPDFLPQNLSAKIFYCHSGGFYRSLPGKRRINPFHVGEDAEVNRLTHCVRHKCP